jgi:hypothetical protein
MEMTLATPLGRDDGYRRTAMVDILGLDTLLAQIVLALGAALLVGNAFALWQDVRGKKPKGEQGELRRPRAWFLFAVGAVMAYWGLASLITG